ncbi:MAG: hypothetical protein WCT77_09220 [Bacteroidota bacterium]|jgi:hypothetical protein
MKKYIITIVLLIFTISCKDTDKEKLYEIANDIILHPEKVLDLKSNYPDYYNPKYIDKFMQDSIKLHKLYQYIDTLFQKSNHDYKSTFELFEKDKYIGICKNRMNFDRNEKLNIYQLTIWKNYDIGLQIIFFDVDDNYYISYVGELRNLDNWEDLIKYP